MKITDVINKLNKNTNIRNCPEGIYPTIKDVYDVMIEPNLPKVDVVQKWHFLLLRYSLDKDAVFMLRKYSSYKIDGEWATRRGMLTKYNKSSYVGIDNYFAHLIFALAHIEFIPDYDDFKSSMINRTLPIRFRRETPIEKLKSAYPSVSYDNVGINDNNWKLSHIVSANQNYPYPLNRVLKENFPNTSNSDWILSDDENYYARRLDKEMTSEEISALRIHFLRVCNPINQYLTPKTSFHKYLFGRDIGEDNDLILYVKKQFQLRYGILFNEYLRLVKDDINDDRTIETIGKKIINLETINGFDSHTNSGVNQSTFNGVRIDEKNETYKTKTHTVTQNITKDQLFRMITLYINQGYSFRELEKRILYIDSKDRGGGFVSKSALNDMGVTAVHKGTIRTKDQLIIACSTFDGDFGKTLRALMNWLNESNCSDYQKFFI